MDERLRKMFFSNVKKIPYIRRKIQEELDKNLGSLEDEIVCKGNKGMKFFQTLPKKGLSEVW